jgi:hypothetical protein
MKQTVSDNSYYVYVYYDPRNGDPIYVGLGRGQRAFKHWKKKANNPFFQNVLNKIRAQGLTPRIEFVSQDLTLNTASKLEIELIKLYGRRSDDTGTLTNITEGGEGFKGMKQSEKHKKNLLCGIRNYWDTVDRIEHGKKISQVFSSRTLEELETVCRNVKLSRTEEVKAKIGASTKIRMSDGTEFKAKVLASTQTSQAQAKRQASLKSYSNTIEGRENRRRAANIRWEKKRAEDNLLLSGSSQERM